MIDLRDLTREEQEAAELMAVKAFSGTVSADDIREDIARSLELYPPEWYLGAFDGDEMTSMMRILPSSMRLNGGTLPCGIVAPVATSHLHRRRGHAGALLRRSLELMRDRGQVWSALSTPHPALYRRYGWEVAGERRVYSFKAKDLRLATVASERGRFRFATADDWQVLDAVHRRYAALRNGSLDRDELWWRHWVMRSWSGPLEAVTWESDTGAVEGYVIYIQPSQVEAGSGRFLAVELASTSANAYLNLLAFLGQQDIREDIEYFASSDDPLPLLFEDAERLVIRHRVPVFLRLIDVQAALTARLAADSHLNQELTLEVEDKMAPWNSGTWRVRTRDGTSDVVRADGYGEIRIGARALVPVFNGHLRPSTAASAGLLLASSADAIDRADALFSVLHPPHFSEHYRQKSVS